MSDSSNKISGSEEMNIKSPNGASSEETQKKTCADCGTTKTPLWRGGPAGPKSLCNACGIRSRKKRRAILGLNKTSEDRKSKKSTTNHKNGGNETKIGDGLKQRLLDLGREVLMQRSTVERQRRKLGEEEQAAVLLMALSYGSVYA
ncbi:hypothetical protein UlMin_009617 [Ulmus minor]